LPQARRGERGTGGEIIPYPICFSFKKLRGIIFAIPVLGRRRESENRLDFGFP
jgi:hypothetical protein